MPRQVYKKRPTIDDVARLSGLSIATVSRYMNGTVYVSQENAARIQSAIETLNYIPHPAAQTLAGQRTKTLGLLLPHISGDFFAPILRGVETCASQEGYSLLVHSSEFTMQGRGLFKRVLGEHNTDGVIVFTGSLNDSEIVRLNASGLPVVLLYQLPPDALRLPHVLIENTAGMRQLVLHLAQQHGRTRILHLRGEEDNIDAGDRERGYRAGLAEAGLPFDPDLLQMGGFDVQISRLAVHALLERGVAFDAVLAADDESAAGAMMALREAGISVPEQVSVTGFDDISLASHLAPPLTTVHSPIEETGYEAARLLVQSIRGETVPEEILLPTSLVIRQTCGCPAV